MCGLGLDPTQWPRNLSAEATELIVAAVPHALLRISLLRGAGRRVPRAIYSEDLAHARDESAEAVAVRYSASAASTRDYPQLLRDIKSARLPLEEKADLLATAVSALSIRRRDRVGWSCHPRRIRTIWVRMARWFSAMSWSQLQRRCPPKPRSA